MFMLYAPLLKYHPKDDEFYQDAIERGIGEIEAKKLERKMRNVRDNLQTYTESESTGGG